MEFVRFGSGAKRFRLPRQSYASVVHTLEIVANLHPTPPLLLTTNSASMMIAIAALMASFVQ